MTENTPIDHQAYYTNQRLRKTRLEATKMTKLVRVLLASKLLSTDQPNSLAQEPRDHPYCKVFIYSLYVRVDVRDMFGYVCACMYVETRSQPQVLCLWSYLSFVCFFCLVLFLRQVSHWPRPCCVIGVNGFLLSPSPRTEIES